MTVYRLASEDLSAARFSNRPIPKPEKNGGMNQAVFSYIQDILQQREDALYLLRTYGGHAATCSAHLSDVCRCGWLRIAREIRAETD